MAWARWLEAEEHLAKGPPLIKAPSGYVQQSPWLTVANKQLDIMARYMAELGLTPSARARLRLPNAGETAGTKIEFVTVLFDKDGNEHRKAVPVGGPDQEPDPKPRTIRYELDARDL